MDKRPMFLPWLLLVPLCSCFPFCQAWVGQQRTLQDPQCLWAPGSSLRVPTCACALVCLCHPQILAPYVVVLGHGAFGR